jgi:SAM-dependent methyltransferase
MMADYQAASVLGVDISEECIRHAHERALNAVCADFPALDGRFDAISMWHVIEHVRDPKRYLEHAYRLLQPGGWLLIETPVVGSISEGFGADWRFYMPVEHINLFSQQALFRLCSHTGFDLRSWVRFGSGNTAGSVPPANKRAMDRVAKQHGFGDTLAALYVKPAVGE